MLVQFCTTFAAGRGRGQGCLAVLLNHVTVLVVEEDRDNRELLSAYLQLEGATVCAAASIGTALEATGRVDVVVSELLLADGDGCELLRRFRAQPGRERVPALALTALSDTDWKQRALQGGFDHCASKPLPLTELTRILVLLCRR